MPEPASRGGGVSAPGEGVCSGGCLLLAGSSAPGRGVCSQGVGCLLPGVSAPGGVSAWGCGIPACTEADTPPCEQNDRQV